MKKNTLIVVLIIFFTTFIIMLSCVPKILKEYEKKSNEIIKNNCKSFVQLVMIMDGKNLENEAKTIVEKYNEKYKNPITKKEQAFTLDKKCKGCISVSYDNKTESLNVTGYDKNLEILYRTVIKPPSFVTYEKEEK